MRPILIECHGLLPRTTGEIAAEILHLDNWRRFRGWGPIPGIRSAEFEPRTDEIVGSRIRVVNLDGSSHVEEIIQWQPDSRLQIKMIEFSAPLSRLASHFEETWLLNSVENGTRVQRQLRMFAKTTLAWLPLWMISFFLSRAIRRHLTDLCKPSDHARTIAR